MRCFVLSSFAALLMVATALGCESYEAPPKIETINLVREAYDQDEGPLQIRFQKPLAPETLSFSIYLDRSNVEEELCTMTDGALPAGCMTETTRFAGPCERRPDAEFRLDDPALGRGYRCEGATFVLTPDESSISLELESALIPFERYVLVFEAGLTGADGQRANNALVRRFQAAGAFELAPIDFEPGLFFTVFDVTKPVAAQFHFFFYILVDQETGQFKMFGADVDPNDSSIRTDTNRNPADWHTDPNPPTGAVISAQGQVADSDGGRVIAVFPFQLKVVQPAIEAADTELSGKFQTEVVAEAPPGDREVVRGSMFAARVFLGAGEDRAELGAGSGRLLMFRLTPEEAPPLEALLPDGVRLEDVLPGLTPGD